MARKNSFFLKTFISSIVLPNHETNLTLAAVSGLNPMQKKIVTSILAAFIFLFPFSGIVSSFSIGSESYTLVRYLMSCIGFSIFMFIAAFLMVRYNRTSTSIHATTQLPGWLLFAVGPLSMVSFNMQEPGNVMVWMGTAEEENARYITLIGCAMLVLIAAIMLIKNLRTQLSTTDKGLFGVLVLGLLAVGYDFYAYMQIPERILDWGESGQNIFTFMKDYDFNDDFRGLSRALLYAGIGGLLWILHKKGFVKEWFLYTLGMFILLGILFAFLYGYKDIKYHYPFVVPAVGFLPAYALGIYLLASKGRAEKSVKTDIN
jgi:hypothetical protein